MNQRIRVATVLTLVSFIAMCIWLILAGIESAFGIRVEANIFWVYGTTVLPLLSGIIIFRPKIILFLLALLIPFGTAMIGAVEHIEIWKEWYFWVVTLGCVAYMSYFLLNTTTQGTNKSE